MDEVLNQLEIEIHDKEKLIKPDWSLAMPFEMFFETFLDNSDEHQVLDIFKDGSPTTNHLLIPKCYTHKVLNEAYTTNFDLLIEKAFDEYGIDLQVFRSEEFFSEVDESSDTCKLIKVHGSIDDIESIRTTLSTITNKNLTKGREKVIERLFASPDSEKRVLILGYSCSDIFDIVPKIEKIFNPQVSIYLLEHNKLITEKDKVILEDINLEKDKNPFRNYKGKKIKVNTDAFVRWLWEKIDSDYTYLSDFNDNWKRHIVKWIENFHSRYLKFTIIGQLFFRITDYELALKYHQKALDANEDSNKRGEGASYSNMGLIYNSKKEYEKAIQNFEKASSLFNQVENFYYGRAAVLTNMGSAYIHLANKTKALISLKKSLLISRNNNFKQKKLCESDALSNLGLLYEKEREFDTAIYYYTLTLEIDKQGNKSGEAQTLADMARVYGLQGNLKEAMRLFKVSNEIAHKIGIQSLIIDTNEQLEDIKSKIKKDTKISYKIAY